MARFRIKRIRGKRTTIQRQRAILAHKADVDRGTRDYLEGNHKCKVCGDNFQTHHLLERHIDNKHGWSYPGRSRYPKTMTKAELRKSSREERRKRGRGRYGSGVQEPF